VDDFWFQYVADPGHALYLLQFGWPALPQPADASFFLWMGQLQLVAALDSLAAENATSRPKPRAPQVIAAPYEV
jgi:hypothetical protein